ncbi:LysR family transcriptional regulator [Pandoraea sp.]|uniref:winged helix-turn-helix domain-containing protein n=1 Tax=Pandoraea sp. TaxID=1883445 RepID=UPI00121D09D6|nr:LysR family transcriptional regulator [Pandoraea sp.]TAL55637.1 MAG: LysR family transcriptional regulator [Pandoraea sp.]TAM16806.1 MAG: LysR family transcriptional regulator [Pandoraea sp.]
MSEIGYDLRVRIRCGEARVLGPGKVQLLQAIEQTGSISAAARQLGMSYRRAWLLVEAMNRDFREPVVTRHIGGVAGGGANVTPFGHTVLEAYARLEADLRKQLDTRAAAFAPLLNPACADRSA